MALRRFTLLAAALIAFAAMAAPVSPPPTVEVLRLAGKSLEAFWDQLPSVNCVETVNQEKLDKRGKSVVNQNSTFDYLVLLQLTGNQVLVQESRTPIKQAPDQKESPLLVTNGFSTLSLIFHPVFQHAFEYSAPEPVQADGRDLLLVGFRHVHGAPSPSALRLRGHDYPVEWQGRAWIDPRTGEIVRIAAELAAPMDDVGLKSLNADVRYAPVRFSEKPDAWWLPQAASIEVETLRQHWRNTHTFADYRLFTVDVKTETEAPK